MYVYDQNGNVYIKHSGIKGMHWGKKNGPPYPLKESQKSSSEKRLSKKQIRKNKIKSMSNDELKNEIYRMKLEKEYEQVSKKGKPKVLRLIQEGGENGIKTLASSAVMTVGTIYLINNLKKGKPPKKNN